jgi:hypothetical protein
MRKALQILAWGLAVAAMVVATPLRAGATGGAGYALAAQSTADAPSHVQANTPRTPVVMEVGGGWDELLCAACVGAATYALFSGGTVALPVLLSNTGTVGTLAGACLNACKSVIGEMMK